MKKLLFIVLLCTVATSVWAAEPQWFGSLEPNGAGQSTNWFDAAMWRNPSAVPTTIDKAKLNRVWNNAGPVISAPDAIANEIFISEDLDAGTIGEQSLTVATGGTLTVNGQVLLGYNGADPRILHPGNEGRLIMAGGTANLLSHLFVGFTGTGHLQVDDGTLNVSGMFAPGWNGGVGTVDISGGLLHTEQWNFNVASSYSFNFSELRTALGDGEWVQNHFWKNELEALVTAGKITTTVSGAHVQVDWDPVLEQTHVYAIPEPVSIVMLGLGALLLRKRS